MKKRKHLHFNDTIRNKTDSIWFFHCRQYRKIQTNTDSIIINSIQIRSRFAPVEKCTQFRLPLKINSSRLREHRPILFFFSPFYSSARFYSIKIYIHRQKSSMKQEKIQIVCCIQHLTSVHNILYTIIKIAHESLLYVLVYGFDDFHTCIRI